MRYMALCISKCRPQFPGLEVKSQERTQNSSEDTMIGVHNDEEIDPPSRCTCRCARALREARAHIHTHKNIQRTRVNAQSHTCACALAYTHVSSRTWQLLVPHFCCLPAHARKFAHVCTYIYIYTHIRVRKVLRPRKMAPNSTYTGKFHFLSHVVHFQADQ
jgi:hypothetical protein